MARYAGFCSNSGQSLFAILNIAGWRAISRGIAHGGIGANGRKRIVSVYGGFEQTGDFCACRVFVPITGICGGIGVPAGIG